MYSYRVPDVENEGRMNQGESTTPQESEQPTRPSRRALLAWGIAVCALYFAVEIYLLSGVLGFPLDDSWIHLQFARNLATGHGLSFNPGELVPGSTAPLWTALLSVLFLLPGSPVLWTKLAGIALFLAGGFATHRLGLVLGLEARLAVLATALTLATSWLVWSALSGLEIPLFVLVSVWGIVLHLRERRQASRLPSSLAVFALAFLIRPEAVVLLSAAVLDRFLVFGRDGEGDIGWRPPRWRPLLIGLAIFVVVATPLLLFNYWISGSMLPTTFGAKSGGLQRWVPEMGYLYTVFGIFFQAQPWMALFAGAGVLALLSGLGSREDRGLLPVLWLIGLPFAYGLIDPPGQFNLVGNFGRYFFPLFPVVVVLGMLGIQHSLGGLGASLQVGSLRVWLRVLGLLILSLPTLFELVQGAGRYGQSVLNVQESDVRVAHWLAGRLSPEAVLAVADIGAIKFFLPNRVVDLAGIGNPEIKTMGTERFLDHHRPDYLVIFPNWYARLFDADDPFEVVREFPIEDNITMGGDILAVYSTPWTRYPLTDVASAPGGD